MSDQSKVYRLELGVQWGDCDPAGIVYFPRFFDMFHQAMEGWFSAGLGVPYDEVIMGRKIGFPSVHTEADFTRPCRFGERIGIELRVGKVGRSSVELLYRIVGAGDPSDERGRGKTVCVVMDLDPDSPGFRRSLPFPDDLRAAIVSFAGGD